MNEYSPSLSSHLAHVLGLLEAMASQGTQIWLLVERAEVVPPVIHERIRVSCLPTGLGGIRRWLGLYREISRARRQGYTTAFIRISSWSALAAIVALRGRRGRVFFWQSGTTIEFDKMQPWSVQKGIWMLRTLIPSRLTWKFCDVFTTGPSSMAQYYASVGKIDPHKIRVLHNDVAHQRFSWSSDARQRARTQLRQQLGLVEDSVVMLLVHRLSPVRRTLDYLPLALEAVRSDGILEGTCLVVAGGGGDLPELQRRCIHSGLQDHVRFLGDLPNDGIEAIYAGADVFLQPSHAEGFPRVLVEAMVAGLPVVSTDAGGSAEILGARQQEFVVDREKPEAFGRAVCSLLKRRDIWADLSSENRRVAKQYDTPVVARLYRTVLFDD